MRETYWFQGNVIPASDFSLPELERRLPLPLHKISEIHNCSMKANQLEPQPPLIIKNWNFVPACFDLTLLLLNRLQASSLESMLIIEAGEEMVSLGFFGSAAIVGKYNLPPEFEIKTSGWAAPNVFSDWLNHSQPTPRLFEIKTDPDKNSTLPNTGTAGSLLEAFLITNKTAPIHTPLIFQSITATTISYLTVEKI